MGLFQKKTSPPKPKNQQLMYSVPKASKTAVPMDAHAEAELYRQLRVSVPIIDAAIQKIVRLTGSFSLKSGDPSMQKKLDCFVKNVPAGGSMRSLQSFADIYLDSLITYGSALGEMCIDTKSRTLAALMCAEPSQVIVSPSDVPGECLFSYAPKEGETEAQPLAHPERILFSALSPQPGELRGVSVLRGLPALSNILLRIYECIGQNYDRCGNVRYAVVYKPSNDPADRAYAGERAKAIAREWSDGMASAAMGEVRDFVCAGDVEIKVIGADNQLLSTEIPVRQLLEQLIAKLSIPPFLLGLNWSSTERMSSQQADILTSELEYYRRILTPVLCRIGETFLRLNGSDGDVAVEWSNISLKDETELAQARLWNAQAAQLENELGNSEK